MKRGAPSTALEPSAPPGGPSLPLRDRIRAGLALDGNLLVTFGAMMVLGMGEELWQRYVPKYLELLGAGTLVIALYGTLKDLLDAVYQYPGGWLADRLGRRAALILFTLLALIGYAFYLVSTSWAGILIGTVFVMAWSSLTLPAIFAVIGDSLPSHKRAMGFGVQAILKRVPMVLAPPLGAALIALWGMQAGFRLGVALTIALALLAMGLIRGAFKESPRARRDETRIREIWRAMDPRLKRLLVADILARWAEGIPKVFIILFVVNILGGSVADFGWLTSLQMIAATLVYLPVARLADRMNRKPFVLLTFAFFALFPLVLVSASDFRWVAVAFAIAGLREIGEPARKALIVDLADAAARGRAVGIYYLIRGLMVFPAALVGGWLWSLDPRLPFYAAFAAGVAGCLFYTVWGRGDPAPPGTALSGGTV